MRRGIAATALVASLALMATACGGSDSGSDESDGPLTITWWDTSNATNEAPTYKALVKEFEAAHKNIKVKYVNVPFDQAQNKFDTAAGSKGAPDVLRSEVGWTPAFAKKGFFLPLDGTEAWTDGLLNYWQTFGQTIGQETAAARPPPAAAVSRVRAVRVAPDVAGSIQPRDLNIVLDRLRPMPDQQFDLVVATNVLVYYDVFEQALALANIASMLRPGGLLLTNTAVLPTPPMKASASYLRVPHTAQRYDDMFWYERDK